MRGDSGRRRKGGRVGEEGVDEAYRGTKQRKREKVYRVIMSAAHKNLQRPPADTNPRRRD